MKYKLGICSLFRDSMSWYGKQINQVERYFIQYHQCISNTNLSPNEVKFYSLEGNSKDDTLEYLNFIKYQYQYEIQIFKHDVVGSDVASSEDEIRFKNLSKIGNIVLNAAKEECDKILFVESDLIVQDSLINELLRYIGFDNVLAISPITTINNNIHYDCWAFRDLDGSRFVNSDYNRLKNHPNRYRQMSSIGSCAMLDVNLLRQYNIDFGEGCFPELCRKGREAELIIYCDTQLEIQHPDSELINGRYV